MPKVTILLIGTLRSLLSRDSIEVEIIREVSFREVWELAAKQIGQDLKPYITDPKTGEILPWVAIFVDGENLRHLQGWETPLPGGNKVVILRGDMAGG